MRKDIQININTEDIRYGYTPVLKTVYPYKWVDNPSGLDRYIYGEITIPYQVSEKSIRENGISITIPYTPIYKEFCIRIKREREDGYYSYVYNTKNGSEWFIAKSSLYGGEQKNLIACQTILIDKKDYFIELKDDIGVFYSNSFKDFLIDNADRQNANLLLKCVPTNFYRYPLTGVGLIKWTNSNMNQEELARVLMSEFQEDGVLARNISYDFENKNLIMDLSTITD